MLLADAVDAVNGKLYVLGAGWDMTSPPSPMAIALLIQVPWDQANHKHEWKLELVDSDGSPVEIPTPVGDQPFVLRGAFEVGRPPGIVPGAWLAVPVAINLGPVPLAAAKRYEWRLSINDETDAHWRLAFGTRSASDA